jgi:hypothetical protein
MHGMEVYVALDPIDLRLGFDRLAGVVTERLGLAPGRPRYDGARFEALCHTAPERTLMSRLESLVASVSCEARSHERGRCRNASTALIRCTSDRFSDAPSGRVSIVYGNSITSRRSHCPGAFCLISQML